MSELDITDLILSEHELFRRAFSALESITDPDELGAKWRELADQLEVHASAEEEIFYPALLKKVDDAEDDTEHAVKDHNEIRETTRKVDDHEVGTDAWWEAFRTAREATVDHLGEEERDVLPPFKEQVEEARRDALGEQFLRYRDTHEGAKGLSGEEKDPEEYVEQHT